MADTEINLLLKLPEEDLFNLFPEKLTEAILRVRKGEVFVKPGYDGEYGVVKVFAAFEPEEPYLKQQTLFSF